MQERELFNLQLATSQESVDAVNKEFYGRFSYPWPPVALEAFPDKDFWIQMLHQDVGNWTGDRLPPQPEVWVAGCGTNQAVQIALRMPQARVLGTDISTESLQISRDLAVQLGADNLELKEISINQMDVRERFDYAVCTGVIHHNADPAATLQQLSRAMKPDGILELMVYNYYHRLLPTAYQKAIRNLSDGGASPNFERELSLTRSLIERFPVKNLMGSFLAQHRGVPDAALADALLQPVEHSFTVETLEKLAADCQLELLLPCVNPYDKSARRLQWHIDLGTGETGRCYESLPDTRRWQIANLLLLEDSPMLWFYLQRRDSPQARKSDRQVCREFLDTRFARASTTVKRYVRRGEAGYVEDTAGLPFPIPEQPSDDLSRKVFDRVRPEVSIRQILRDLGAEIPLHQVDLLRVQLTTTAFPYLRAVGRRQPLSQEEEE